ncbi:MAG: TIM barrel protein [Candidatus Woesearchaeota archaeon]
MKLLFGTAGIPISANRNTISGIEQIKKLGLGCMELEFVHGVNLSPASATLISNTRGNIELTAHSPYYVNLNAVEKAKRMASRTHILKTARIAWLCGAKSATFHAAFYLKQNQEKVYQSVKSELIEISRLLEEINNKIWLRPELTGKPTQFGNLREIIMLSQEIKQVLPCIDYAHYFARSIGKKNSHEDYAYILEQLEKSLGREALNNMHIHISGINYGEKGEKNHLPLRESELNYQAIVQTWKDYNINGCVICESPVLEEDALLLKKIFESA